MMHHHVHNTGMSLTVGLILLACIALIIIREVYLDQLKARHQREDGYRSIQDYKDHRSDYQRNKEVK